MPAVSGPLRRWWDWPGIALNWWRKRRRLRYSPGPTRGIARSGQFRASSQCPGCTASSRASHCAWRNWRRKSGQASVWRWRRGCCGWPGAAPRDLPWLQIQNGRAWHGQRWRQGRSLPSRWRARCRRGCCCRSTLRCWPCSLRGRRPVAAQSRLHGSWR